MPIQAVDVARGRIANEVRLDLPLLGSCFVKVEGDFRRGDNGRQAQVDFDLIELYSLPESRLLWRNDWLFAIARKFNPALFTGGQESSAWLETTYLSDNVRVGRGNKGSCFLLTRELSAA